MTQKTDIQLLDRNETESAILLFTDHVYFGDQDEATQHFDEEQNGPSDTFIATADGQFAGFITIRWEPHNEQFKQNNIPFIHHLEVKPGFKGLGLGHALMDAAENLIGTRATHAGICVGVFRAYGPAQRLYAKRGYLPDGRGVCQHHRPVEEGETVTIDHDLMIWLIKELKL